MLFTPFGQIKVVVDGIELDYEAIPHTYDRPPVKGHPIAGCYRIHVPVGEHHMIRCEVELNDSTIRNTGASGERYIMCLLIKKKAVKANGI